MISLSRGAAPCVTAFLLCLATCVFTSWASTTHAQAETTVGASVEDAPAEVAPPRSLETRYLDTLAGTWAASGVAIGGVGLLGTVVGLSVGCSIDGQLGCGAGAAGGAIAGASLGWLTGPLIGTSLGAGLEPLEGLGVWALGLGTNLALVGVGALVGWAIDQTQHTWGLGRAWGLILGVSLGALAQMFLTPLYAVLLHGDRPARAERSTAVAPLLAPIEGGFVGGITIGL